MTTIDIPLSMPLARVADLLCSGFEGGIGYWARIVDYVGPDCEPVKLGGHWDHGLIFSHIHCPLTPGGAVIVKDCDTSSEYRLDLAAIEKGLRIMAEKYPRHFGDWLDENDDAVTGDVFIQCCLLGDVLYG